MNSELWAKYLLYIVDPKIKPNKNFDDRIIEKHKYKVRDILIDEIDLRYPFHKKDMLIVTVTMYIVIAKKSF